MYWICFLTQMAKKTYPIQPGNLFLRLPYTRYAHILQHRMVQNKPLRKSFFVLHFSS